VQEPFEWGRVFQAVFSIKTWLSASSYLAILTALYSFGLFVSQLISSSLHQIVCACTTTVGMLIGTAQVPTIVQGLGYTAVRAQLFSVPPYAVAAVLTVIAAFISDRRKTRGPVMLAFLPLSIAGYAMIRTTTNNHVKYGALFLMAGGLYPSVPPVLVWLSNNYTNHYTRATAIGLQLAIANCGGEPSSAPLDISDDINIGFPATFVYETKESPVYKKAHTIVMGMLIAAWVLVAIKCAYLWYLNRQKELGRFEKYRGCGDDRDPDFKYII